MSLSNGTSADDLRNLLESSDNVLILEAPASITLSLLQKFKFIIFMVTLYDKGHHWLCARGVNRNKEDVRVFDSYGLSPEHNSFYDVREVIRDPAFQILIPKDYTGFQAPNSPLCGQYCVAYVQSNGDINVMRQTLDLHDVDDMHLLDKHQKMDINLLSVAHDNDRKIREHFATPHTEKTTPHADSNDDKPHTEDNEKDNEKDKEKSHDDE